MARLTPDQLAVFVAESCERQGVPVKVTDARVLANVGTLLRGDGQVAKSGSRSSVVAEDESVGVATEFREAGS